MADDPEAIEAGFRSLIKAAHSDGLPPAAMKDARAFFFAGARHTLALLFDGRSEEARVMTGAVMHAELERFYVQWVADIQTKGRA